MSAEHKAELRSCAQILELWHRGFDTAFIAREIGMAEHRVERLIWGFLAAKRETAA